MKKYMSSLDVLVILTCLIGALVLMTNEARSQTSDDETPAEESICDGLTGAAWGLCNAYCEAMDCDSSSPEANDQACTRVLENFERITGALPPCEEPVCSEEDISECGGHERICSDGSRICSWVFRNGNCLRQLCVVPLP